MWPGIEADLIPAEPRIAGTTRCRSNERKDYKAWLAGEFMVRCEQQGLQSLPPQLFRKTTLRRLILNGNAIAHLPEEIQQLRELRILQLGHNQLQVLPDALCYLQQLEHLDVQHNQLEAVPEGLCRLVHLVVLNLDGNPLSSTIADNGPALHALWPSPTASSSAGKEAEGCLSQLLRKKEEEAAATSERLKQGTELIIQHLLASMEQQDPQAVLAIKQAKLKLLQEASAQRISRLVTVADTDSLSTCLQIATSTGLSTALIARIQQSQTATQMMMQAVQQAQMWEQQSTKSCRNPAGADLDDTLHQLAEAIRVYEELCKPGKPSGPVYTQAHTLWRTLRRQQLEYGWRCSSPASPVSVCSWSPGDLHENSYASPPRPRRSFLTPAERGRQDLTAASAQTHDEWCSSKQEASAQKHQHWQAMARLEAKSKVTQAHQRAARAIDNCSRENAWPSKVIEAYPAGTFSVAPKLLKAIKKQYQRPPLD